MKIHGLSFGAVPGAKPLQLVPRLALVIIFGLSVARRRVKDGGNYYFKALHWRYRLQPLGIAGIIGAVRDFTKYFSSPTGSWRRFRQAALQNRGLEDEQTFPHAGQNL